MCLSGAKVYSAVPVSERPVSVQNSVTEGHFIRFSKGLSEMGSRLVGYEPSTKFQNLRCEKISSLRLKSAKLKKKTYYHAFLRKILRGGGGGGREVLLRQAGPIQRRSSAPENSGV